MKKYYKYIIVAIISGIIFSSIAVYATTIFYADQIKYNKNGVEITLDTAIDELYENANTLFSLPLVTATSSNSSQGDRTAAKSASIRLNKGNYLIQVIESTTFGRTNEKFNPVENTSTVNISCTNCTYNRIISRGFDVAGTTKSCGYVFTQGQTFSSTYYVTISSDNTTVSASTITTINSVHGGGGLGIEMIAYKLKF